MSPVVIEAQRLSKRYLIGRAERNIYPTMRESIVRGVQSLGRRVRPGGGSGPRHQEFWALRDISFEIRQGDRVGIVGRNGAGKTTLLKILSRITEPYSGRVRIRGRVATLLEVGTGFHPELTGRENIFLNSAILGMSRSEIRQKFDAIVAFADLAQFLETPVKRYSSGMYVRLAFAIAAHLEPDILIVDEVLAVGDAQFQQKCLGKMDEAASTQGRTVLFVSHNLTAVQSLCNTCLWLQDGQLVQHGLTRAIVHEYLRSAAPDQFLALESRTDRSGDGTVRFTSLTIDSLDPDGVIRPQSRLQISIGYKSEHRVIHPRFLVSVYDQLTSVGIFALDSDSGGGLGGSLPAQGYVRCVTEPVRLTPGRCYVNIRLRTGGAVADYIQSASSFDVQADASDGTAAVPEREWVLNLLGQQWSIGGSAGGAL